jgi:pentatricopeptide repeat protein
MASTIVEWVVEMVDNGSTKSIKFNSYDEALDVYNQMKLENVNSNITIQKSEKKLLVD